MSDGPFTDDMIRHMILTRQTQHEIIKYIEGMAQILAAAAIASNKAIGDSPDLAVRKWLAVIRDRADEIIREERNSGKPSGKVSEDQGAPRALPRPARS